MQEMVMKDVSQLEVSLDPELVDEQVIAESGGYHGVLDLLAMTRTDGLAIMELKATENPELPLAGGGLLGAYSTSPGPG
jgi:hypothetical protein